MGEQQPGIPSDYGSLLTEIKLRVRRAQSSAAKAVNQHLVSLYQEIGGMIVGRQENAAHGSAIATQLGVDLRREFPGIKGFSRRNLFYMRELFLAYRDRPKVQPLVAQIGWSHNLVILQRCKTCQEREFYLRMTKNLGWSKRVLIHQIEGRSFEETLLGQSNFDRTLAKVGSGDAKLAFRDEYIFDFLELGLKHTERELERALLHRVENFLQAMGGVFAFLGSQYRLEVDDREYYVDLLLFHRSLRCLIAMELKVGDFKPEFVGKMQFYLSALDQSLRKEGENASIGIILCKEKSRTVVEYTLRDSNKPIGVATYRVVNRLPKELEGYLPDPNEIERLLEELD